MDVCYNDAPSEEDLRPKAANFAAISIALNDLCLVQRAGRDACMYNAEDASFHLDGIFAQVFVLYGMDLWPTSMCKHWVWQSDVLDRITMTYFPRGILYPSIAIDRFNHARCHEYSDIMQNIKHRNISNYSSKSCEKVVNGISNLSSLLHPRFLRKPTLTGSRALLGAV